MCMWVGLVDSVCMWVGLVDSVCMWVGLVDKCVCRVVWWISMYVGWCGGYMYVGWFGR